MFSISKHNGVMPAEEFFGKRVASANLANYKTLSAGAWVYSTIHIDEGSIARNNTGVDGVVSPMYTVMNWSSRQDDPRYLEHLLRSKEMLTVYADSAQGSINRRRSLSWKAFSTITIVLPPLEEQKRIVDLATAIDDAVDAAEAEALADASLLDRLRMARLDGQKKPLGNLLTAIESGVSVATAGNEDSGPRLLRISAVRHGRFDVSEHKRAGNVSLPERARVHNGDILMTRSNTPDRVGFVAIAGGVDDDYYMPDLVWRLVPDAAEIDSAFLVEVLSSDYGREEIRARASGTSASMQKISKARISSIMIPVPRLEAQGAYVAPLRSTQESADAARSTVVALRNLRSNLLTVLLSGGHEIPASYDYLLEAV
ncbi:Restriction endonuclease S subunit [Cryobacterium psychrotolerans]|uniref:Restriction endonuclease S subunit n=1 Tax=Cryobacterium psychrotolerans TaxID=386301 RepID=A0A1G9BAM5_9MICO|nr:Restriction endonuclease S subunit [Cryobacterium psychrotolerans]